MGVSQPLYALHVLVLLTIISVPLWPIKYLQYGVYIPLIITFTWFAFGACPLTDADPELDHFTHHLASNFIDGVSVETVDNALIFTMVLVTFLGTRKLHQGTIVLSYGTNSNIYLSHEEKQ